jgi:hypothetical protein
MVFGVPLAAVQSSPDGLPLFLKKAAEAVEARGMEKEGIYRLSAKKGDVDALRIQVETDFDGLDFMNQKLDVHILTNLVKQYFREMSDRLLWLPSQDRVAYSSIPDLSQRLSHLLILINGLSNSKRHVLEFLARHLKRVSTFSAKHKMGIPNLALVFSGTLFDSESPCGVKNIGAVTALKGMEFLKTDLLVQDLIENVELLFCPTKTPPSMEIGKPRRVVSCKFLRLEPPMVHRSRSVSSLPILLFSNEQLGVGESSIMMDSDELSRVSSQTVSKDSCDSATTIKVPCDISQLNQSNSELTMPKQSIPTCSAGEWIECHAQQSSL